jgi:D-alanine-D-alanine ligase
MALNLAYGIQGKARYTQVPSILEMVGIPYVGSGPLAHSLSLDKVVAKVLFQQAGLPTPDFTVVHAPGFETPDLPFPLIVKPKSGADSFGLKVVRDEEELREATDFIFKEFEEPVLVERFIDGREINVGVLGNPPEAFPPVELDFSGGPNIYSNDDKGGRSGRTVGYLCPADLDEPTTARAQDIARRAFTALGCYDCARVDVRLDPEGNLYLLELNSLPSLGYRGSFVIGAQQAGLDFQALVNRLVEVASARYFGTPTPAPITTRDASPAQTSFQFLTSRRDQIERRVSELVSLSSRTEDTIGIRALERNLAERYREMGLQPVKDLSDEHIISTWETAKGMEGGTLLVAHLDMLLGDEVPFQAFRRDPEWLYGEAIGVSRAPLAMLEFALRSLRHQKRLRHQRIGVLVYADEARACRYSRERIARAASRVKRVLVLQPGSPSGKIITRRRGLRTYQLVVEGKPAGLGQAAKRTDVLRWACNKIEAMAELSSRKDRLEVFTVGLETTRFPDLLPHRVRARVLVSYPETHGADETEARIRGLLGKGGPVWQLHLVSDRPPMLERRRNAQLAQELADVAESWEIPLVQETSASPSVAGLVPEGAGVVCGLAPLARDLHTPHEAVQRTSLVQHTLLLAQFLVRDLERVAKTA